MSAVTAFDTSYQTRLSNPYLPDWVRKLLLLKNCATHAFAYAKDRFNLTVDKYRLEVSTISEIEENVDKIQAILLRFLLSLLEVQLPKLQLHLQNAGREVNFDVLHPLFLTCEEVAKAKKQNPLEMMKSIVRLCGDLVSQKRLCETMEIATIIPNEELTANVLQSVSIAAIKLKRYTVAIEAINLNLNSEHRDPIFFTACRMLATQEPFEEATLDIAVNQFALRIREPIQKSEALKIAALILDKNSCSKSDQVARLIPLDHIRESVQNELRARQPGAGDGDGCSIF